MAVLGILVGFFCVALSAFVVNVCLGNILLRRDEAAFKVANVVLGLIWGGVPAAVAWYLGAFKPLLRGIIGWVVAFAIFHWMWRKVYPQR
jgi:hypothetical protein